MHGPVDAQPTFTLVAEVLVERNVVTTVEAGCALASAGQSTLSSAHNPRAKSFMDKVRDFFAP